MEILRPFIVVVVTCVATWAVTKADDFSYDRDDIEREYTMILYNLFFFFFFLVIRSGFSFQNNLKDLDPSYKTDLDF